MDRIALDLEFIQIYWYSLFIFFGILVATFVILKECKRQNINEDFIVNLIFYTVIFGLIGARLYYVCFNLDYYLKYPLEILEIWNGGLAIHGGIIAGLLCIFIYCKKYNAKLLKLLDIVVVGLIIGQAIGRWGNFFNQEAYGSAVSLDFLQSLHLPDFIINGMHINGVYYQPTFLYESVANVIGFLLIFFVIRKIQTKQGEQFFSYFIWYGIIRFFIEGLRTDSLYVMGFRTAQLVSIAFVIVGVIGFIYCKKRGKPVIKEMKA